MTNSAIGLAVRMAGYSFLLYRFPAKASATRRPTAMPSNIVTVSSAARGIVTVMERNFVSTGFVFCKTMMMTITANPNAAMSFAFAICLNLPLPWGA